MGTTVLFPDTNVFLHYKRLEQIDWFSLIEAERILIVLPPVIFRELNKHKDTNHSPKLRKRARTVLADFGALFQSEFKVTLRQDVDLECVSADPQIDFPANQLRVELQDDFLLASVLEYRLKHPETDCRLVTADVGLSLKARQHRILTVSMAETFKLPEDEDPNEKRIKELEAQLRELNYRSPEIKLCFEDNSAFSQCTVSKPVEDTLAVVEREMMKIKDRYPRISLPIEKIRAEKHSVSSAAGDAVRVIPQSGYVFNLRDPLFWPEPKEVERYNNELDKFYEAYKKYWQGWPKHKNRVLRTFCLRMVIMNQGTAPADDMDVLLHFPDGFRVIGNGKQPQIPEPPDPPEAPKTVADRIDQMTRPSLTSSFPYSLMPLARPSQIPNVSYPTIERSNSYRVSLHVRRLKHGLREPIDPLYIVFDSYETASSFHVDYVIHAANIPRPVEGRLNVIVNKV